MHCNLQLAYTRFSECGASLHGLLWTQVLLEDTAFSLLFHFCINTNTDNFGVALKKCCSGHRKPKTNKKFTENL